MSYNKEYILTFSSTSTEISADATFTLGDATLLFRNVYPLGSTTAHAYYTSSTTSPNDGDTYTLSTGTGPATLLITTFVISLCPKWTNDLTGNYTFTAPVFFLEDVSVPVLIDPLPLFGTTTGTLFNDTPTKLVVSWSNIYGLQYFCNPYYYGKMLMCDFTISANIPTFESAEWLLAPGLPQDVAFASVSMVPMSQTSIDVPNVINFFCHWDSGFIRFTIVNASGYSTPPVIVNIPTQKFYISFIIA